MNSFFNELNDKVKQMPWPVIMPADFKTYLEQGHNMAIIDVRDPEGCCFSDDKIDNKHIFNIPFNSLVSEVTKLDLSSYESIVMVCFAGPKGAVAASIMRWMGMDNVYFLKGGVEEFSNL